MQFSFGAHCGNGAPVLTWEHARLNSTWAETPDIPRLCMKRIPSECEGLKQKMRETTAICLSWCKWRHIPIYTCIFQPPFSKVMAGINLTGTFRGNMAATCPSQADQCHLWQDADHGLSRLHRFHLLASQRKKSWAQTKWDVTACGSLSVSGAFQDCSQASGYVWGAGQSALFEVASPKSESSPIAWV